MAKQDTAEKIRSKAKVALPPMYRVVLLNDDYSTMDFVVNVLQVIFRKTLEEANKIMLDVHNNGRGVCGVYPKDIAELKVAQVHHEASRREYPLRAVIEEDEGK